MTWNNASYLGIYISIWRNQGSNLEFRLGIQTKDCIESLDKQLT